MPKWKTIGLFLVYTSGFASLATGSNGTDPEPQRQGWTDSPTRRGTLQIVWSCVTTLVLCCWSIICTNIPGPDDSGHRIFGRKLWLTLLCMLGPEFTFISALGQHQSAKRSVRDFHADGYAQWSLTHAFYADMGGIVLKSKDWPPFPLDSHQLLYLIKRGYVQYPHYITQRQISDRNKNDSLLRFITILQAIWFLVSIVVRAAEGLAITTLELTTTASVVCGVGTVLCWSKKPADVRTCEYLESSATIAEILVEAGRTGADTHGRTPLDFISRKEWWWSLYWSNWVNILRAIHVLNILKFLHISWSPPTYPVNRFENTVWLEVTGVSYVTFTVVSAAYLAIFVAGWNYSFPTDVEQTLWRAAAISIVASLPAMMLVTHYAFDLHPRIKHYCQQKIIQWFGGVEWYDRAKHRFPKDPLRKLKSVGDAIRNNSSDKDPALNVPLKAILLIYIVAVFYCSARTYIWISDFVELRSLPESAYISTNWNDVIPHF